MTEDMTDAQVRVPDRRERTDEYAAGYAQAYRTRLNARYQRASRWGYVAGIVGGIVIILVIGALASQSRRPASGETNALPHGLEFRF